MRLTTISQFGFSTIGLSRLSCLLSVLFAVGLASDRQASADWPQWRGPNRTGHVESAALIDDLPTDGLKAAWKFDSFAGGTSGGWSSPVIVGDRVFAYSHTKIENENANLAKAKYPWLPPDKRTGMSDQEYKEYEVKRRDENEQRAKSYRFYQTLLCLDLNSGEKIWEQKEETVYTRFTQSSTPCVADNRVFVLTPARTAKCYDALTGDVLWSKSLPGEFRDEFFASSFTVQEEIAIVCCGPLVALNVSDGDLLWKGDGETDYQSHSSPAIWSSKAGAIAISNTSGGRTEAYWVKDGKKLWELKSGSSSSSPVVAGDLLLTYGSSRKSGLTASQLDSALPEKTPEQAWQFRGAADSGSSPVIRGDAVFVQGAKRVAKLNLAGETIWQTTLKISTPKYTSLIGAGDQLFYGWEGLLAINANADEFTQVYDAEIDSSGRLIRSEDLRKLLKLDEIAAGEDGLSKSEKIWQEKAVKSGPLACSTPAFSDGRMVLRLRDAIICFDLRK